MTNENFPTATVETQPRVKKNFKNAFIGVLAAVVAMGGYMVYDRNKSNQTIKQDENKIAVISDEKSEVQKSFDASLARLDSMTGINTGLEKKLVDKTGEIAKVKSQIRSILNKSNASAAELATAKKLISGLNVKITGLEADVARLTEENKSLNQDKMALTADKEKLNKDLSVVTVVKQDLEKKVDIASTLNASNIIITPINVKRSGKEKVSTTAKRVDKLVISFDVVDSSRVAGVVRSGAHHVGAPGACIPDWSNSARGKRATFEFGDTGKPVEWNSNY